jgi:hypothetical protein
VAEDAEHTALVVKTVLQRFVHVSCP